MVDSAKPHCFHPPFVQQFKIQFEQTMVGGQQHMVQILVLIVYQNILFTIIKWKNKKIVYMQWYIPIVLTNINVMWLNDYCYQNGINMWLTSPQFGPHCVTH